MEDTPAGAGTGTQAEAEQDPDTVLKELRAAYPRLHIWTENIAHAGLHWMASGDPNPRILMSHDLDRFRTGLEKIAAEEGR